MKHLTLEESLATFESLFRAARREMFKAEVLQDYTAVDDCASLRAWLAGDKPKAQRLGKVDANIIAYRNQCLKSPAKITRVHVVQLPLTAYLEWEIAVCYKDSLLTHDAEQILIADAHTLPALNLPAGDFWIFDTTQVLQWEFEAGTGKTSGACLWIEGDGDDISYFCQLKKALLAAAVPLKP